MSWFRFLSAALFLAALSGAAQAAIAGLERVASGITSPVYTTHAPGDFSRLFIVELGDPFNAFNATASIRILNLNTGILEPTPFLTLTDVNTQYTGGVGGLAFHPDYANNGKFYVNTTVSNSIEGSVLSTNIREYTVSENPNISNENYKSILELPQENGDHNGGWIGFSPVDGYLYIPTGDGGCCNDEGPRHSEPTGNAQDLTDNLLGKLLRIDVDGDDFPNDPNRNYRIPDSNPYADVRDAATRDVVTEVLGDDEIWAYGFRNPFRGSFDRLTGDLWLGDVGQATREEIDFQPASSTGGENYGWRLREGSIENPKPGIGGDRPEGNVDPIYDYGRSGLYNRTVVGGYVYRGPDPDLQGQYFFADAGTIGNPETAQYWILDPSNPSEVTDIRSLLTPNEGEPSYPTSFGEDAAGNLYITFYNSNDVYRIATDNLIAGDYNADGKVDIDDYEVWRTYFGRTDAEAMVADGNSNGEVGAGDYTLWRNHFGESVHNLNAGNGTAGVPEPTAVTLVGQLALLLLIRVPARAKL